MNGLVVNCFQISIFAVHEQQDCFLVSVFHVVNCFQISIFAVHEQQAEQWFEYFLVVNCFQISIFAVHEQLSNSFVPSADCCELLSN